jgi:hypothetical protein
MIINTNPLHATMLWVLIQQNVCAWVSLSKKLAIQKRNFNMYMSIMPGSINSERLRSIETTNSLMSNYMNDICNDFYALDAD